MDDQHAYCLNQIRGVATGVEDGFTLQEMLEEHPVVLPHIQHCTPCRDAYTHALAEADERLAERLEVEENTEEPVVTRHGVEGEW